VAGVSTWTVLAGLGVVMTVAYAMRALQQAFFRERGESPRPTVLPDGGAAGALASISIPERIGAVLLIGTSLAVGCTRARCST